MSASLERISHSFAADKRPHDCGHSSQEWLRHRSASTGCLSAMWRRHSCLLGRDSSRLSGFFRRGGFLIVSGLLFGGAGSAHHAFSWEFDAKKPVTVSGVVTRVDWINPHTYFYVDVKNGQGLAVNWIFETAGPNTLDRHGWHRDSVKKGDEITVLGFQARSAANIASARLIVLHDGRKVIVGSPGDGGPQP